jgi:hypothetical protein
VLTPHQAAERYVHNDWPVIPLHNLDGAGRCSCGDAGCAKKAKHPRIGGWQEVVSDPAAVERWWRIWPNAGIGLRLDHNVCLDIDLKGDENGFESLAILEQENRAVAESCVKQRSGSGGEHQLYRTVEGVEKRIKFRCGLDLLCGNGCFIVVQPSTNSSGSYQWLDTINPLNTDRTELVLSAPPAWLLDAAKAPAKHQRSKAGQPSGERKLASFFLDLALKKITAGEIRNAAGMFYCCQLRDAGFSRDEAFLELRPFVDAANEHAPKSHRYTMREAEATLRSVYKREARDPWSSDSEEKNQTDIILELTEDFEFFRSGPSDDGYVRFKIGSHREVHFAGGSKGPSLKLRQILTQRYLEKFNRAPGREGLNQACDTLCARCGAAQRVDTFVRFARFPDRIYVDLCNDKWEAIEVAKDGWRIISEVPVLFRRGTGSRALPTPTTGGSLETLRDLLNAGDDETWRLMLGWVIGVFLPTGAFPILNLEGEQGSAKSTTSLLLLNLIDPQEGGLAGPPKDEADCSLCALHSGVLAFDNLKGISGRLSDVLCRMSTGQSFRTRKLYQDTDLTLVTVRVPILLNGIADVVLQADLMDRCIQARLPAIPPERRTTVAKVFEAFESIHASCLGGLLDAVSCGLANLPHTTLDRPMRMSDFCVWVASCEPKLPWKPGEFLRTYRGQQEAVVSDALELDDVGAAILAWADANIHVGGAVVVRPLELLRGVNEITMDIPKDWHHWPRNPEALAHRMPRLQPGLRTRGIHVKKLPRGKRGGRWQISREEPQGRLPLAA